MTLSEVLKSIGYTHTASRNDKHAIYNEVGELVGNMRADECWEYLRERGLIEN